jgi:putative chitinase
MMLSELSVEVIQQCTNSQVDFAERYQPYFNEFCPEFGIYDHYLIGAAFFATVSIETRGLEVIEEDLYYKDPVRVANVFRRAFDLDKNKRIDEEELENARNYVRKPAELSRLLYAGKHGRGLTQLTWEENYEKYSEYCGVDCVSNPDLLLQPLDAVRSACWFWKTNKCSEAVMSGGSDDTYRALMTRVTRIVNGPALMHLEERIQRFSRAVDCLLSVRNLRDSH